MDLSPFIARGFPGKLDEAIANVGVAGIDRQQSQSMVRLCEETEATLYGSDFSPYAIAYTIGTRPALENITDGFVSTTPRERAICAMHWVSKNVVHPHLIEPTPPDRALSEEALIDSACGWCNEQARVFIALCEVMEIPARLCFVNHDNNVCGHTATEVFLNGRWAFFDVTFNITVELPSGRLAEARELSGAQRNLAHAAYRPALESYFQKVQPFVEKQPGWCSHDRPDPERGGDLLGTIGICNYLIEGVQVL